MLRKTDKRIKADEREPQTLQVFAVCATRRVLYTRRGHVLRFLATDYVADVTDERCAAEVVRGLEKS